MAKRKLTLSYILLFLCLLPVSFALAYIVNLVSGWNSEIKLGDFQFRLNGELLGQQTEIEIDYLSLGDMYNLDLEVRVDSKASTSAVEYTIEWEIEGELQRAIEVYELNQKLTYRDSLANFNGYQLHGFLGPRDSTLFSFRLLYSLGAPSYYNEQKATIRLTATPKIVSPSQDYPYYFISSEKELFNLSKQLTLDNPIIVLMDDITLDKRSIEFKVPVSIDLKNHQLHLSNHDLIFAWDTPYDRKVSGIINTYPYPLDFNFQELNLISTFGGEIIIDTPDDIFSLADSLIASFEYIKISSEVIDDLELFHFSLSGLGDQISLQLSNLASSTLRKDDAVYHVCQGFSYYFSYVQFALTSEVLVVNSIFDLGVKLKISSEYDDSITASAPIQLQLSANQQIVNIVNYVTVLGSNPQFLAEFYLSLIPDEIDCSIFLPIYDALTQTHISWRSYDSSYLSDIGIYLPFGYQVLENYQDRTLIVGLTLLHDDLTFSLDKTVTIKVFDGEKRTNLILKSRTLIMSELDQVINLLADCDEDGNLLYCNLIDLEKSSLISLVLSLESNNYVEVMEGNLLKLVQLPYNDNLVMDVSCLFTYENNGDVITYTTSIELTVVGESKVIDLKDPTSFLLYDFLNNPYSDGEGYQFYVRAYTDSGLRVIYTLKDQHDFISIENDIYLVNSNWRTSLQGSYILLNGQYVYIGNMFLYSFDGSEYHDFDGSSEDIYIFFSGAYHNLNDLIIYQRFARVTILPAFVPPYNLISYIEVQLINELGNPLEITYQVYLPIEGIYHHQDDQIKDYYLYLKLLSVFDLNGDSYISVTEAQSVPLMSSISINAVTYSYLDFSSSDNLKIGYLKGLEYFINVPGFSFYNHNITDLSPLQEFYNLSYLDLGMNKVTSLEPLAYLDCLEVLKLNNTISTGYNNIWDLTPLKYLPNVRYLDLTYNELLTSLSALENYQHLTYLKILQNNSKYLLREDNIYYLLLLYAKNNNPQFYIDSSSPWTPPVGSLVAASVLEKVETFAEVYNSLYVPGLYYYQNELYKLIWDSSDRHLISFVLSSDETYTTGYNITSPLVDRDITLSVKVSGGEYGTSSIFTRTFKVRLLQSQLDAQAPRIEIAPGVIKLASEVIPDTTLRGLLFQYFNTSLTGTISDNQGNVYDQYYTLSQSEIASSLYLASLPFDFKGIKNLEGIQYFSAITDLDLTGNSLTLIDGYPNLRPLSFLYNLEKLSLSGQLYDFTHLSFYEVSGEGHYRTQGVASGLTSLRSLNVVGAYGLDSDEVLTGLYHVYLSNPNVSIYLTSTHSTWNPYTQILNQYNNNLITYLNFFYKGSEVSFFYDENHQLRPNVILEDGRYYFAYQFYGVIYVWFEIARSGVSYSNPSSSPIQGNGSGNINYTSYYSPGLLPGNTLSMEATPYGLRYQNLATYSDNFYILFTIYGYDYSQRNSCISLNHYVNVFVEKPHYINISYYVNAQGDVYYNLDGRDQYFDQSILASGGKKITAPIFTLFPGRDLSAFVINHLNTFTNYPLNDESAEVPLYLIGSYYPGSTLYETLSSYPLLDACPGTAQSSQIVGITISSVLNSDTYQNPLTGLYLIRRISRLQINGDATLGDGYQLQNITWLEISNSIVDFSTLRYSLPALLTLYVGRAHQLPKDNASLESMTTLILSTSGQGVNAVNFFDRSVKEDTPIEAINPLTNNYYYYFNYLPNLVLLEVVYANCYNFTWLKAYHKPNNIKYLSIFGGSANDITGRACANQNNATSATSLLVDGVLKKSSAYSSAIYFIGTVQSPNTNPYTTMSTLSLSHPDRYLGHDSFYGAQGKKPAEVTHLSPHLDYRDVASYIQDLGLRINDDYYFKVYDQVIHQGDQILLPLSTFEFFGTTNDDSDAPWRTFAIQWKINGYGSKELYSYLLGIPLDALLGQQSQSGLSTYTIDHTKILNFTGEHKFRKMVFDVSNLAWDFYFFFTGTIGNGYYGVSSQMINYQEVYTIDYSAIIPFSSAVTGYNFAYPLLVKGSEAYNEEITSPDLLNAGLNYQQLKSMGMNRKDTFVYFDNQTLYQDLYAVMGVSSANKPVLFSYLIFEDPNLRFMMFNILSNYIQFTSTSYLSATPGILFWGEVKKISKFNLLSSTINITLDNQYAAFNFNTGMYRNFLYTALMVTTLNGSQLFSSLQSIRVSDYASSSGQAHPLYSLKGLELAYQLETLEIMHCAITDISDIKNLSKLKRVDLSFNMIDTIHLNSSQSVFEKSSSTLEFLNLNANFKLKSDVIPLLANFNVLKNLGLYNTLASNDLNTLYYLFASTFSSINLALNDTTFRKVTHEDIQIILNYLNPETTSDEVIKKWRDPLTYGDYVASDYGAPSIKQGNVKFLSPSLSWNASGKITSSTLDGKVKVFASFNFSELVPSTPFSAVWVEISIVFLNSSYTNATGGFILGTSSSASAPQLFGSDFVTVYATSGTKYYCYAPQGVLHLIEASSFEASLYGYLAGSTSTATMIDGRKFIIYTSSVLSTSTNYGITTLKGLEQLFTLQTIAIKNNPLRSIGWEVIHPLSRLQSITLGNAILTLDDVIRSLSGVRGIDDPEIVTGQKYLTTFDFSLVTGINYMEEITDYQLLLLMNPHLTIGEILALDPFTRIDTLAKLITSKLQKPDSSTRTGGFHINNEYNYHGVYMENGDPYAHYNDYLLSEEEFLEKYEGIYDTYQTYNYSVNNAMYYSYQSENITKSVKVLGTSIGIDQFGHAQNVVASGQGLNIFTIFEIKSTTSTSNSRIYASGFDLQYKLGLTLDTYHFFFSPVYRQRYYQLTSRFNFYDTDYLSPRYDNNLLTYLSDISGQTAVLVDGIYQERTTLPSSSNASDTIGFKPNSFETYSYRVASSIYMYGRLYRPTYEYSILNGSTYLASTMGVTSFTASQLNGMDANLQILLANLIDEHMNLRLNADNTYAISSYLNVDSFTIRYAVSMNPFIGTTPVVVSKTMKVSVLPSDLETIAEPFTGHQLIENDQLTLVPASTYFKSPRFVYWLFNVAPNSTYYISTFANAPLVISTLSEQRDGYPQGSKYIAHSTLTNIKSIRLINNPSASSTLPYMFDVINDFSGIELFTNLETFQTGAGWATSLLPLSSLRLKTISLDVGSAHNSSDYSPRINNTFFDFSPLYNSKDTLTTFNLSTTGYSTYGASFFDIVDLSFLKMFTNLKNVKVGFADSSGGGRSYYRKTSAFRTLMAYLRLYGNLTTLNIANTNYLSGTYDVTVSDLLAASIFAKFTGSHDLSYQNNYELVPVDTSGVYTLPKSINVGGEEFKLHWIANNPFLKVEAGNLILTPRSSTNFMNLIGQIELDGIRYDYNFVVRSHI